MRAEDKRDFITVAIIVFVTLFIVFLLTIFKQPTVVSAETEKKSSFFW